MKPWQFAVVGLALLATAGCRSDPAIPILERQLRLKEDEIYRLRATIEDFQDGAQSCQGRAVSSSRSATEPDDERPRRRTGANGTNGATPPSIELPSESGNKIPDALKTPAGSLPSDVPDVPEHLRGPSRPLRPEDKQRGGSSLGPTSGRGTPPGAIDGPALEGNTAMGSPRLLKTGLGRPLSEAAGAAATPMHSPVPFTPSGDSRRVAAIALNRTFTGGINAGDNSGDQGLLVVVEPRDRTGRTVDAPADMSIAVLDPALTDAAGKALRVARWDFTAAETAAMFRRAGSSRAIHLTTAWPGDPPKHNKLHLFVRYVTADGRKLEANQPIEVALTGEKTARWTPTDLPARTAPSAEHESASESWQPNETPTARVPGPASHTASRSRDSNPDRPVWSPERR